MSLVLVVYPGFDMVNPLSNPGSGYSCTGNAPSRLCSEALTRALAAYAGDLREASVGKYETGVNRIPASRMPAIATALGVSVVTLYASMTGDEHLDDLAAEQRRAEQEAGRLLLATNRLFWAQPATTLRALKADLVAEKDDGQHRTRMTTRSAQWPQASFGASASRSRKRR